VGGLRGALDSWARGGIVGQSLSAGSIICRLVAVDTKLSGRTILSRPNSRSPVSEHPAVNGPTTSVDYPCSLALATTRARFVRSGSCHLRPDEWKEVGRIMGGLSTSTERKVSATGFHRRDSEADR
jgi:hypothetical protein